MLFLALNTQVRHGQKGGPILCVFLGKRKFKEGQPECQAAAPGRRN